MNCLKSGFRSQHSSETPLIKITNDLLLSADSGFCSVLILLDLSSAFDPVDRDTLISRLEHLIGISGVALEWFKSYLSNRSFSVSLGDACSSHAPLFCGVPQESFLGPPVLELISRFYYLFFKALSGQAPVYIRDLLLPCLRPAGTALLMVLRSHLIKKGDRAFAVCAPQLWNSLPGDLRQATSVTSFKSLLKTHFYRFAFS